MGLAYYKRFPRDFIEGTIGLTFEEKGAYSILLDLIYVRDGRLPDDARFIAGNLGCSVRKWNALRDALIAKGKIQAEGGFISNFRADDLLEETRKFQDKQAENRTKSNNNNGLKKPNGDHPEPEPEVRDYTVIDAGAPGRPADDWPDVRPQDLVTELVAVAASPWLDPSKSPNLITTSGRIAAWRCDGASWVNDVVPVVTGLCARVGRPVSTWKFFDAAVAQSIADSRAALVIPETPSLGATNRERPHAPTAREAANADNLARAFAGAEAAARRERA